MKTRAGRLVAELKRRRVFRVAVVYVVAGWLVIQVATAVFPVLPITTTSAMA